MRYAVIFAVYGVGLLAADVATGWPFGVLVAWPAASCLPVAAAYGLDRPRLLGKRSNGTMALPSTMVLDRVHADRARRHPRLAPMSSRRSPESGFMSLGESLMTCFVATMALVGGAFAGWEVHRRTGFTEWVAVPLGAIVGVALFALIFEVASRLSGRKF